LVDNHPQLYLDEILLRFGILTGNYLCSSTIWNYLSNNLGYSMRVLNDVAKQRSKDNEISFLNALQLTIQDCPEQVILIDETHKDRNAARRRRGWKFKNSNADNNESLRKCI
jgi:hypothetical protein